MDSENKMPRLRSAIFRTVHDEPLIGVSPKLVRSQSAILRADSHAFLRHIHQSRLESEQCVILPSVCGEMTPIMITAFPDTSDVWQQLLKIKDKDGNQTFETLQYTVEGDKVTLQVNKS